MSGFFMAVSPCTGLPRQPEVNETPSGKRVENLFRRLLELCHSEDSPSLRNNKGAVPPAIVPARHVCSTATVPHGL